MRYLGSCHCEALGVVYETVMAPEAWPMRACECRFCRSHGAATTSDPNGSLQLVCRDMPQLQRYRFGLGTADFCVCRRCGVYLAAITVDGRFGILNTHALVDRGLPLVAPVTMSYDGETAAARTERRAQRWTPVRPGT
ncbi:MAG TPA: hypothetical protein VFP84_35440 [Kofleriaceae bacterium]|nr:hypothetical protein [Kofleriaceae bacterium]